MGAIGIVLETGVRGVRNCQTGSDIGVQRENPDGSDIGVVRVLLSHCHEILVWPFVIINNFLPNRKTVELNLRLLSVFS